MIPILAICKLEDNLLGLSRVNMDIETVLWCVHSIQILRCIYSIQKLVLLLWHMLLHIVIMRSHRLSLLIKRRIREGRCAMLLHLIIAILIVWRSLMMNMRMEHAFNMMMNMGLRWLSDWLVCYIHGIERLLCGELLLILLDFIGWSA